MSYRRQFDIGSAFYLGARIIAETPPSVETFYDYPCIGLAKDDDSGPRGTIVLVLVDMSVVQNVRIFGDNGWLSLNFDGIETFPVENAHEVIRKALVCANDMYVLLLTRMPGQSFTYARVTKERNITSLWRQDVVTMEYINKKFPRSIFIDGRGKSVHEVASGRCFDMQANLRSMVKKMHPGDRIVVSDIRHFTRDVENGRIFLDALERKGLQVHLVKENLIYPLDRNAFLDKLERARPFSFMCM